MDLRSDDNRQPEKVGGAARNWLDLPRDVAAAIMRRVGAVDVLTSAQYVCTAWRGICREPSMWRHVSMQGDLQDGLDYDRLCRLAVDLSQGGLLDIAINDFANDGLLLYIAERSSQLKHLELAFCKDMSDKALASVAAKIPLLEELEFTECEVSCKTIEVFGRCCLLLKTFKLNHCEVYDFLSSGDEEAHAIAENMPGLVHLYIRGNRLTNDGLEAIMVACPQLESLDLRVCLNLNLCGQLEETCAKRIKNLRLPEDPVGYSDDDGYLYYDDDYHNDYDYDDFSDEDLGSHDFGDEDLGSHDFGDTFSQRHEDASC